MVTLVTESHLASKLKASSDPKMGSLFAFGQSLIQRSICEATTTNGIFMCKLWQFLYIYMICSSRFDTSIFNKPISAFNQRKYIVGDRAGPNGFEFFSPNRKNTTMLCVYLNRDIWKLLKPMDFVMQMARFLPSGILETFTIHYYILGRFIK